MTFREIADWAEAWILRQRSTRTEALQESYMLAKLMRVDKLPPLHILLDRADPSAGVKQSYLRSRIASLAGRNVDG